MKGSDRRERSFDTAESETLGMCGNSMRENREAPQTPTHDGVGRSKKAHSRNVDMRVCGESDGLIVPTKRANKADAYAFGGGVRRGKEVDQGERTTSALAPDPEPGDASHRGCGAYGKPYPNERLAVTGTRGKSRMRESLTYGSGGGAVVTRGPYRDGWKKTKQRCQD